MDNEGFELPKEAFVDMLSLSKAIAVAGDEVAKILDRAESFSKIAEAIAEVTKLSKNVSRGALQGLLNLYRIRDSLNVDAADFIQTITEILRSKPYPGWSEKDISIWTDRDALLAGLLMDGSPVGLLEKSTRLTYRFGNIFQSFELYTDIRPVFDEPAENVARMLIVHKLLLIYRDGAHVNRLEVSLDCEDLEELCNQCDRAKRKAAVLMDAMRGELPWATVQTGY